ncbi:DDE-type integrase/transposase/recombinase, partial [Candidatus Bathyarchaeota archaeon]|nr:DDE-type integrase/transposase/recombinase [Candidatus Bathyarchaeota archaeon]
MVAVDETKIKANGEWRYVWAAIDVDTRELLAIWVSWQRNIHHAEAFMRRCWRHARISQSYSWIKAHGTLRLSKPLALNGSIKPSERETALKDGSEQ